MDGRLLEATKRRKYVPTVPDVRVRVVRLKLERPAEMMLRVVPVVPEDRQYEAQRAVRVGEEVIDRQRLQRRRPGFRHSFLEGDASERPQKSMAIGQTRPSLGNAAVFGEDLLEAFHCPEKPGAGPAVTVVAAFQVHLVSSWVSTVLPR
jgi:hypothetical protein